MLNNEQNVYSTLVSDIIVAGLRVINCASLSVNADFARCCMFMRLKRE